MAQDIDGEVDVCRNRLEQGGAAGSQVPACPSLMVRAPSAEGWTRVCAARM